MFDNVLIFGNLERCQTTQSARRGLLPANYVDPGDHRNVPLAHGVLRVKRLWSMYCQQRTARKSSVLKRVSPNLDRRIVKAPVFIATMLFEAMLLQAAKIFALPTALTDIRKKMKKEQHLHSLVMGQTEQKTTPTITPRDLFTIFISPSTGASMWRKLTVRLLPRIVSNKHLNLQWMISRSDTN